jgi:hypothetical protein
MAHALALDYALRPVLLSMGAGHVVEGSAVRWPMTPYR